MDAVVCERSMLQTTRRGTKKGMKKLWRIFFLPGFLSVACVAPECSFAADEARVSVHVTSMYGDAIPSSAKFTRVQLVGEGVSLDLTPDEITVVAYGKYEVTVESAGFISERMGVLVSQPEQVIRIAMRVGSFGPQFGPLPTGCYILGTLKPATGVTSIRLLQVFGHMVIDVPPHSNGSFTVRDLECGDYMVMALGASGCRGLRLIRITKEKGKNPAIVDMELPPVEQSPCGRTQ